MLFLDVETKDRFDDERLASIPKGKRIPLMRFGLAVTYDDGANEWREWYPADLHRLWAYMDGKPMCGWNIRGFDLPVIWHNLSAPDGGGTSNTVTLDLFDEIRHVTGRWYRLDEVARATLGRGKSGDGAQMAAMLNSGHPTLVRVVADYCRDDVILVQELVAALDRGDALILPPRADRRERETITLRIKTVDRMKK